jgi:NAD(P)H dehydrogenase (quinone)
MLALRALPLALSLMTQDGREATSPVARHLGGKTYELSGDTAWSFAEYAAEVSRQIGRDIAYQPVSPEEYTAILASGDTELYARIIADSEASMSRRELAGTNGDLSRLTGRPTTPIADTIAAALR